MSTYTQILYQIVFGSKGYTSFLKQENQDLLFSYIVDMLNIRNCYPYQAGGYDNHENMF
jgi:putative transposase